MHVHAIRPWIAAAFLMAPAAAQDPALFEIDNSARRCTLYTESGTGLEVDLSGFSGLLPLSGSPKNRIFVTVTDRGPKVDVLDEAGEEIFKAYVVPDYAPRIVTFILDDDGTGKVLAIRPLRKPNGKLCTGITNACSLDEGEPLDLLNLPIPTDPDGIDPEGIARDPNGMFWICDEYRPSVAMLDSDGTVLLRLIPAGSLCGGEEIPSFPLLPAVYAKRVANRGFEGIACSPDGKVYAVLQRPLDNPLNGKKTSEASRMVRMVEIDAARALLGEPGAVRQLLYITEEKVSKYKNIYLNDLCFHSPGRLLIVEREKDGIAGRVFAVDLNGATDITEYEDEDGVLKDDYRVNGKTTIELLTADEVAALGIAPVGKTEVLDFSAIFDPSIGGDPNLEKIEGLTISGGDIYMSNDNDFNLEYGTEGVPAALKLFEPANTPRVIRYPLPVLP